MNVEIQELRQRYSSLIKREMALLAHKDREINKCDNHDSILSPLASPKVISIRPSFSIPELQLLFNQYFRDDLYGKLRDESNLIMSSGSLNSEEFPLCQALKYAIDYSLTGMDMLIVEEDCRCEKQLRS